MNVARYLFITVIASFALMASAQDTTGTRAREQRAVKRPAGAKRTAEQRGVKKQQRKQAKPGSKQGAPIQAKVKLGCEVVLEETSYTERLRGKRLGLITNPTGINSQLVSTIDTLNESNDWELVALFAPEHGLRGAQTAGEHVKSGADPVTGIQVHSLYGAGKGQPTPQMLENIDVLMYDMQDIGNRSYTYITTMEKGMRAAAQKGIPFFVLDRPNPMGGNLVSGNVLEAGFESTVGTAQIAYIYGLTCGELALWLNENEKIGCDLVVVPMKGWKRDMKWWDTGLHWIPTSTHMQHAPQCWFIAITGTIGELHVVNEGVGYPAPFEYIGAPWINSVELADELNSRNLPGLYFRPAFYKPFYHSFKDEMCGGVQILILDFDKVMPVEAGTHIIEALHKLYPDKGILQGKPASRVSMFNKVMGTDRVRKMLLDGRSAEEVNQDWATKRDEFTEQRKKYFLYD